MVFVNCHRNTTVIGTYFSWSWDLFMIEGVYYFRFNTTWMYAECYAYRRLLECLAASSELRDHDCFSGQKRDAFKWGLHVILIKRIYCYVVSHFERDNLAEIDSMTEDMERLSQGGKHLTSPDSLTNDFRRLLETSLWGNKCDLSISAGNKQVFH